MTRGVRPLPASHALKLWNQKARDWSLQVGSDGDLNRQFQSDPRLWAHLGKIQRKEILDAGCGTGYLSIKLARQGAHVTGIDFSPRMIKIAKDHAHRERMTIDFRVDSASRLRTCGSGIFDLIVSNYVLMDLPDLQGAARNFFRVLHPNGRAVIIINHPCFEAPSGPERLEDGSVRYRWPFPYHSSKTFKERWGRFSSPFLVYHRSLSSYWRAFRSAGFSVDDLEEPTVPSPTPKELPRNIATRFRMSPFSILFDLHKPS